MSYSNPAYTLADFLAMYPKFGGGSATGSGSLTNGSTTVTNAQLDAAGYGSSGFGNAPTFAAGQLITGPGIAAVTTITAVATDPTSGVITLTLSQPATAGGSAALVVYVAPIIPVSVLAGYLALANGALDYSSLDTYWAFAMGLYLAHYATLWLDSEGGSYSNGSQAGAAGLAKGIQTSVSVGGVSTSAMLPPGLDAWGPWLLTQYGQQLAGILRMLGAGGIQLGGCL